MKILFKVYFLFIILIIIEFNVEQVIAKEKKPTIIIADNIKSKLVSNDNGKKVYLTELTGNPRIKYDKKELQANKIIIRGQNGEIAEALGNVVLIDKIKKSKIKSKKAIYYKETNFIEFFGKPSVFAKNEDDNSIVKIDSDKINYNLNSKIGEAIGNVILRNKDFTISSGKAIFHRGKKTVIFFDNPKIKKEQDIFTAEKIEYNTDSKTLLLENKAYIAAYTDEKDEVTKENKKVKIIVKGDKIEYIDTSSKRVKVSGNAVIIRDDAVSKGASFEMVGEKGSEALTGSIVHINYLLENIEAYGNNFKSNKKDGYSSLWGETYLIIKDKKTGKETSRIYGDHMEYFRGINEIFISGNIKIINESGIIKGDLAKYTRSSRNLLVTGNVRIEKDNSALLAQSIIIETKSNNTKLIGDIKGAGVN